MELSEISISLPFGLGSCKWKPAEAERIAAWSLYIELVTRVATQELSEFDGLDEDVLRSLYSLFPSTRRVLRRAGAKVGVTKGSLGGVAIAVLNSGLRPFLSKWRPVVKNLGQHAPHEWQGRDDFRKELRLLSAELSRYAEVLAIIAGVGDQL